MITIAERMPMAKAKGRPRKPGGEGTPVRIDTDLVTKAKYLAAQRGVPLTTLMSDLVRPVIEREFRKVGKDLIENES
jgi:hypothetical protein